MYKRQVRHDSSSGTFSYSLTLDVIVTGKIRLIIWVERLFLTEMNVIDDSLCNVQFYVLEMLFIFSLPGDPYYKVESL